MARLASSGPGGPRSLARARMLNVTSCASRLRAYSPSIDCARFSTPYLAELLTGRWGYHVLQ